MSPRQFAALAGATGLLLLIALGTVVAGGPHWVLVATVDKWWRLGVGLVAMGGFLASARVRSGAERRWRLWMAAAMACLVISVVAMLLGGPVTWGALPTTPVVPVAAVLVPVLALAGVLNLVHDEPARRPEPGGRRRSRVLLALDTLIICGSAFVLVLVSALQSVFRAWPRTGPAMAVMVAQPAACLVLLAVLAILSRTHKAICQPPILLLSLAAIAQSASGWAFAVLVGAHRIVPIADIGFIISPMFFLFAAVAPFRPKRQRGQPNPWISDYVTLAVPYLPLGVTFLFVAISTATGERLAPLEIEAGLGVMGLVILRQLVTLVDNTRLLKQVTESQRQLEYQAFHDPLTGLANRTLFLSRLADAVAVHDRAQRPLVLLFADIDGFKTVNDNFGHGAGDAVLRTVADRLRTTVRECDLVARLGGDEFSVLLDSGDADDSDVQSRRISQQLLDTLCAPQVVRGRDICISASIGTVTLNVFDPDLTADELLRRADEAMYAAKRRGKGALVVYGDSTTATSTDCKVDRVDSAHA